MSTDTDKVANGARKMTPTQLSNRAILESLRRAEQLACDPDDAECDDHDVPQSREHSRPRPTMPSSPSQI